MGSPLTQKAAFAALSDTLRDAVLQAPNLDQALRLAGLYGRLHWDNTSGLFQDDPLEVALFDRWRAQLPSTSQPSLGPLHVVHIATQVYAGGGHTRLLRFLAGGLGPVDQQALILTDARRRNPTDHLPQTLRLQGSAAARCAALISAAGDAEMILMHIHPDDAIGAFAARALRALGRRVLFVHHADHIFGFGTGAADVVLELCKTGWRTTQERRRVSAQSFMGIPVSQAATPPTPIAPRDRKGPIVSMGGGGKYKPSQMMSFPRFLDQLLGRVENDVVLIGPSSKDPWWEEVCAKYPNRVTLCGALPPEVAGTWLSRASCYIDSFPLEGGTAYPQAILAGVPVFGPHKASASGISPADALRLDGEAELLEAVTSYIKTGEYPFDLQGLQTEIHTEYSDEAVAARVIQAAEGALLPLPESLERLGRRDPDYNVKIWQDAGKIHLPKRQWKHLSLGVRWRLSAALGSAALPQTLSKAAKRYLWRTWI